MNKGKIIQIIGPVVDVEFAKDARLPAILNALEIKNSGGQTIIAEVAKHLEPGRIRAIALASTDGLRRGDLAEDTGGPINVPVGPKVLGNIFDVLGREKNTAN